MMKQDGEESSATAEVSSIRNKKKPQILIVGMMVGAGNSGATVQEYSTRTWRKQIDVWFDSSNSNGNVLAATRWS